MGSAGQKLPSMPAVLPHTGMQLVTHSQPLSCTVNRPSYATFLEGKPVAAEGSSLEFWPQSKATGQESPEW